MIENDEKHQTIIIELTPKLTFKINNKRDARKTSWEKSLKPTNALIGSI